MATFAWYTTPYFVFQRVVWDIHQEIYQNLFSFNFKKAQQLFCLCPDELIYVTDDSETIRFADRIYTTNRKNNFNTPNQNQTLKFVEVI